jgi:DNA polymerase elongation subunit (family B)
MYLPLARSSRDIWCRYTKKILNEGKSLKAGELLRYIITDFYQKSSTIRAVPIDLIDMQNVNTTYDTRRYTELVAETCNSVIEPFGYTLPLLPSLSHQIGLQLSRIINA